MARKPRQEEDSGTWLNTYSDLVTLLLVFFVLLYSLSSVDAEKWERFVKAFSNAGEATSQIVLDVEEPDENASGPLENQGSANQITEGVSPDAESPLPMDFDDLYAYLKSYVEENELVSAVDVSKKGDNTVYLRFQNNIFFAPDRYDLLPKAYDVLGFIGDCLNSVQDQIYIISINGHTAKVNYDYAISDWMLSSERASRVAIFLEEEKEIVPTKLRPMGYGCNYPIADNNTQQGREQNRRVDMTIIRATSSTDDSVESELASLFDPTQFPSSGGVQDIFTPENAGETVGNETTQENVSTETPALPSEAQSGTAATVPSE